MPQSVQTYCSKHTLERSIGAISPAWSSLNVLPSRSKTPLVVFPVFIIRSFSGTLFSKWIDSCRRLFKRNTTGLREVGFIYRYWYYGNLLVRHTETVYEKFATIRRDISPINANQTQTKLFLFESAQRCTILADYLSDSPWTISSMEMNFGDWELKN